VVRLELTLETAAATAAMPEIMAVPEREDIPVTVVPPLMVRGPLERAAAAVLVVVATTPALAAAALVFLDKEATERAVAAEIVLILRPVVVVEVVAEPTAEMLPYIFRRVVVLVTFLLAVREVLMAEAGVVANKVLVLATLALSALFGPVLLDNSLQLVLDFHKWTFTSKSVMVSPMNTRSWATTSAKRFLPLTRKTCRLSLLSLSAFPRLRSACLKYRKALSINGTTI
jgi:hypothetical protein